MIFILCIISLALLAAWWSVFIYRSIEERRGFHMENLVLTLGLYAQQLGHSDQVDQVDQVDQLNHSDHHPLQPGVLKMDERFEITSCRADWGQRGQRGQGGQFAKPLLPLHPNLCLQVRETVLEDIEKDFKRKKIMVTGESGLLFLLILFSSILLYQFIRLERRSTLEMEEFWGRVTHEIKTPITGIKAFLQSLSNQSLSPEQMPPFVAMALQQIEKQEQLADNILAGYGLRCTNNKYDPELEDIDINQCIEAYFDQHIILMTDAKLSLQLEGGKGVRGIIVRADCHLLRIILDNLVDNALKYCSPGLVLGVRVHLLNKRAVISITDNGPGFPPEVSERLFQAYKHLRGELPGSKHGSGMGLYIARKLAEQMGGKLEASSPGEKKGAEFRLFLNLAKSSPKTPAPCQPSPAPEPGQYS